MICGIIKVEVNVIADNAYQDLDNFAYRKNRIQQLFYYIVHLFVLNRYRLLIITGSFADNSVIC